MGPDQNELSIHGALKVDFDHCTEIDPAKKKTTIAKKIIHKKTNNKKHASVLSHGSAKQMSTTGASCPRRVAILLTTSSPVCMPV